MLVNTVPPELIAETFGGNTDNAAAFLKSAEASEVMKLAIQHHTEPGPEEDQQAWVNLTVVSGLPGMRPTFSAENGKLVIPTHVGWSLTEITSRNRLNLVWRRNQTITNPKVPGLVIVNPITPTTLAELEEAVDVFVESEGDHQLTIAGEPTVAKTLEHIARRVPSNAACFHLFRLASITTFQIRYPETKLPK